MSDFPIVPSGEGVTRQVLADHQDLMVVQFSFNEAGAEGSQHQHPHVQSTYVKSGRFEFTINDVATEYGPGDSFVIPSNAMHGCVCLEPGQLVDCFTPRRDDFILSTTEITAAYYTGNKQFQIETIMSRPPETGEVQIEIAYCGICGTDLHAFHGSMDARIGHHRIIGHEMSGVISAVGDEVTHLKEGQHVVVRPLDHCGACPACEAGHIHVCHNLKFLGLDTDGAFQQRWNVPAHTVHVLPDDLSLAHAALVEPVSVACHDVRRGAVKQGEDVLVIGGGPIGMLVGMVAKEAGANVVISEVSEARLAIAEKLGFTALNPREVNVAEKVTELTGNKGADVVFEVSGTQAGVDTMTEAAACRGRIVMVAIHPKKPEIDLFKFFWRELELLGARVYAPEDYEHAIELVTSGGIDADTMITDIGSLENIQASFEALEGNPSSMKSLIKCMAD